PPEDLVENRLGRREVEPYKRLAARPERRAVVEEHLRLLLQPLRHAGPAVVEPRQVGGLRHAVRDTGGQAFGEGPAVAVEQRDRVRQPGVAVPPGGDRGLHTEQVRRAEEERRLLVQRLTPLGRAAAGPWTTDAAQ